LKSIACNDDEIVTLLWQLINEAVNPNKVRRKIAIMLGNGTNGKSTFRQMLINLMGDTNISVSTPHELQSRFGLTSLEGKICNYGDEVGTKPLDEMDKLKSISSGESVNYERKNKDVRNYDFKTLLEGVTIIQEKDLKKTYVSKAQKIVADVDENDMHFIALHLQIKHKIWTGDKELIRGLENKGYNICITTEELRHYTYKKSEP